MRTAHLKPALVLLLPAILAATPARAETVATEAVAIETEIVTDGLSFPWGMDFLPDGRIVVTERDGQMRIVSGSAVSAPISGVPPVWANGQGGLLDVAVAPDFARSGEIFFTFSEPHPSRGAGTALARARLDPDALTLSDVKVIFSMERKSGRGQHFGSRIVFHPADGSIFITTGDRGEMQRAQDFADHAGAVIRVMRDGSVPADNPDFGAAGAKPELYSKGHRNPQGAAWDPVLNSLLTVEHGARGGDELNNPQPGRNFGWPVITYGRDYSGATIGVGTEAEGMEQPLHYWDPSIAPSGLAVYDGAMFPEWQGDVLAGALKYMMLVRLDRDASGTIVGEERMLEGTFGRIRDVSVGPDGAVWLLTDDDPGLVVRISRAGG